MGTWDNGPFGNDAAADFASALDEAEPEACEALIRGVLVRTVVATGHLREADDAMAAALIAAQCPEGQAVVDTPYGPETPMPVFPSALRTLADEALARIAGDEAGPASKWVAPEDWKKWQAILARLRAVLVPPLPSIALFDVSHNEASLHTEAEPESENGLHMFTTSRGVQSAAAEPPDCSREPAGRYQKLQVLTRPRRNINTDKPRQGVLSRGAGREASGVRGDAAASVFPAKICRLGPVSGILSGAASSSNPLSRRHHSPWPQLGPAGGTVGEPGASDPAELRTVHDHTKREK
ncbi:DUF4259 domain-containing protein [Streptomyces sp. NPDC005122]